MEKYFSIGALKISLTYEPESYDISLTKVLDAFSSEPFKAPDIHFQIDTTAPFPAIDSYKKVFSSKPGGSWTIFEDSEKSQYFISLQHVERGENPYKVVRADREFSHFTIYTRPDENNLLSPLEDPLDELVVSGHININKIGIIIHSAAILSRGKVCLFRGVSGSGKSTISKILEKDKETMVLTDDRVLIREINGELWAFGTPWHGTAEIHKNIGAPIEKIFYIKQAEKNKASVIPKIAAATKLMNGCFPAFWSKEGMQFAVNFCARIAQGIKCYELEFVSNLSVIEYLKELDF